MPTPPEPPAEELLAPLLGELDAPAELLVPPLLLPLGVLAELAPLDALLAPCEVADEPAAELELELAGALAPPVDDD